METYKEEPSKIKYPMNSFGEDVNLNTPSKKTTEGNDLKLKNESIQVVRTPKDLCSNCDHASTCALKSVERFTYHCEHYQ